ncbi:MAG: pantoate--beta-alanine ligase [Acidobacteria bacterium]|nr:MAG: pantoate--beta-alanine ligase [Acidobacteriota bacterium]REK02594.1 MAG: pantoate--beta-alanine ligase [Acidobacteriota bacterium]REK13603.1 MAG: pantoate--beta-alanine ligase [Acidobacteriota bacterium]REK41597.1 MAG: pantoate--beta-alanine ligase [Acidobacteriota bacterium]
MEIITRQQKMASVAKKLRRENRVLGFVPTMGALHEGHLSLIQKARQMTDEVIVSIFVNPTQFNEGTDFEAYPRDLTADAEILSPFDVDYIYAPDSSEVYGDEYSTFVTVDDIADKLEGSSRPGHFRGVATIVTILFNTIRPDFAFFGQKDAQQVAVIRRLVRDLRFDTEIIVLPIVREDSGLARSSRNERLSAADRKSAAVIFRALSAANEMAMDGERSAGNITDKVREVIETEPSGSIDYIALVNKESLDPIEKIGKEPALLAVAVRFGDIRLIDNIVLNEEE